ncbi:hypothetical protein KC19_3G205800 [Ceratodon purpureus]|uniref:Uncharacterized protein n=1 Tax=Ceratodon purpureus TaxID=3225 RepID=A0A8T0IMZ9_CERPU|nr:hypothetical protein KC19_3G205800 [Ceratodon purpureus]
MLRLTSSNNQQYSNTKLNNPQLSHTLSKVAQIAIQVNTPDTSPRLPHSIPLHRSRQLLLRNLNDPSRTIQVYITIVTFIIEMYQCTPSIITDKMLSSRRSVHNTN